MVNLGSILEIRTGLFVKPVPNGEVVCLHAGDFDDLGNLMEPLYPVYSIEDVHERHLLKPGDILFAAKGSKNFAVVFDSLNYPAFASTTFFVLSIKVEWQESVTPAYIAWFLNSKYSKTFFSELAGRGSLISVTKGMLADFEIPVPTLSVQQQIFKIASLRIREKQLMADRDILREKLIDNILTKAIKNVP